MRRLCTDSSCSYSGRSAQQGSVSLWESTEGHSERDGITTEPYGGPGSAIGGNTRRDWAEVSRWRSSQMPTAMVGQGEGLNLRQRGAALISALA